MRDEFPEFLLSDLNMPGMSGFELLSVVPRRFPSIRTIAMSGFCFRSNSTADRGNNIQALVERTMVSIAQTNEFRFTILIIVGEKDNGLNNCEE